MAQLELMQLWTQVMQGLAKQTSRQHGMQVSQKQRLYLTEHGPAVLLALGQQFLGSEPVFACA